MLLGIRIREVRDNMAEKQIILVTEIPDSGRVLDQELNEWVSGWQQFFSLRKVVVFHDKLNMNFTDFSYSASFRCSKYKRVGVAIKFEGDTPYSNNFFLHTQFSDNGIDFYTNFMQPPGMFNLDASNMYIPSAPGGNVLEGGVYFPFTSSFKNVILVNDIFGDYMRIGIRQTVADAGKTVTVKGFFVS